MDGQKSVSRRDFLKVGASGAAGLVVGAGVGRYVAASGSAASWQPEKWDHEADVVVIGGGGGLFAAYEAADTGASVIVLEKAPVLGGQTGINGGWIAGVGTKAQARAGVEDSIEAYTEEYLASLAYLATVVDPALCSLMPTKSGAGIDRMEELGFEFQLIVEVGRAVYRAHIMQGGSTAWVPTWVALLEQKGVSILTSTPAVDLIARPEDGAVVGVVAEDDSGARIYVKARKGVVLATGDASGSFNEKRKFYPENIANIPSLVPTNTGDGLALAQKVGADISGTHMFVGDVNPFKDSQVMNFDAHLLQKGIIFVDTEAKRFTNEPMLYVVGDSTRPDFFAIWDSSLVKLAHRTDDPINDYNNGTSIPVTITGNVGYAYWEDIEDDKGLFKAATLEELASQLGLDVSTLKQTVDTWNTYVAQGVDPEFNRSMSGGASDDFSGVTQDFGPTLPIGTGPFYALAAKRPVTSMFEGPGLYVDDQMRVLDRDRNPIPRLRAAGAAVFMSGPIAALSHGEHMAWICTSALIAGPGAASEAAWE